MKAETLRLLLCQCCKHESTRSWLWSVRPQNELSRKIGLFVGRKQHSRKLQIEGLWRRVLNPHSERQHKLPLYPASNANILHTIFEIFFLLALCQNRTCNEPRETLQHWWREWFFQQRVVQKRYAWTFSCVLIRPSNVYNSGDQDAHVRCFGARATVPP